MRADRFEYRPDGLRQIDSDDADPFGHRDYAASLVAALSSLPPHFTMGLFGPWGSGKSTILEEVRRRITSEDAEVKSGFVLFDAWRYDGDSLRREFLKESARSLRRQAVLDKEVVEELDESLNLDQTTPEKPTIRLFDPDLYKRAGIAALIVGAIIAAATFGLPHLGLKKDTILAILLAVSGALTAFGLLALQPVISPAPLQKTRRRAEFPDEFSAAFRELLDKVKVERLVIAIDNLDRCSPARVTETLATIKTFLEPAFEEVVTSEGSLKQLCFIVAADDAALRRHLTAQELNASAMPSDQEVADRELPREVRDSVEEYLRKFFGASVRIREVLDEDISRFCAEEFAKFFEARPEIDEDTQRELVEMTSQALRRNPRRIVQFVNNLALRLEVLEERLHRGRILIKPEVLLVAKLAIIEEEFPNAFTELQERPQALDTWEIEAHSPNAELDDGEGNTGWRRKNEKQQLADFLRFTDHIRSRHLRAYLDLKQSRDELELDRYAELVDLLDGGDVTGVRSLLGEVSEEGERYVMAVERHFEREARQGNWAKAHNTLRAVSEIPALHGDQGAIASRLFDESLSHPGLTHRLPQLDSNAVLDVGEKYIARPKFNRLVLAIATGMDDSSDSEARRRIANAIAQHADSLTTGTVDRLGAILRKSEIMSDIRSYATLAESVPGVTGPAIATAALERLEELTAEGRGEDGPELRVAAIAIGRTLDAAQFVKLLELGRVTLERLRQEGGSEYQSVANRFTTLLRSANEASESESRQLPAEDERTGLAVALADTWDSIPSGSKWAALRLGYELCRAGHETDAQRGFELGRKIFDAEEKVGLEQWLGDELGNMPERFRGAAQEELVRALAGLQKRFSPQKAKRVAAQLPKAEQTAITADAAKLAISEERVERVDDLLTSLSPKDVEVMTTSIAQELLNHPEEIEERSGEASFLWSHQELLDGDEAFKLGMGLAETADKQRGLAVQLSKLIGALRIDNPEHRLELVQRLLQTEADMSAGERKIAMLSAAIGAAGKRPSNARGAAIGRLRERLGADDAQIANSAKELLAAEGEPE